MVRSPPRCSHHFGHHYREYPTIPPPLNTREYVQTGNVDALAVGVGPIIVNRATGVAFVAPPMPTEHLLAQYAASNGESYNWF